ncbi:RNA-binding protein [Lacihabitans sp. LS3-19]|uniref:VCBS repeat-containing protein n=1 Tax=Lacihabitans sp. LS3-19 TaxID=2487335 RepID=UPI0020CD4F44|nr:VCBS repeat-containing protein [Lacihabitans sp. LS3-19]MCP9767688.1 RNA-binding protein [Lacihabitans sp. LS3-19]
MRILAHSLVYALVLAFCAACNQSDDSKMFTLMPSSQTGIKFKNLISETPDFNILTYGYLYNGGGVSVGDINNDGLQDIYFTGSMVGSRLYLNKGDFEFEEIAQKAGVFAEGLWNTGTTMADVNGDGLLDIYVCRSAAKDSYKRKNLLFINNGNLTFTEKADEYGVGDEGYSTQGAFFDYDRDGDLDLYVLNHSVQEYASFRSVSNDMKKERDPSFEDRLYRNDNGKFKVVNDEAGLVSNVLGFGLGISISDINNDGWSDIYISNDFNEQDYLYINNQNGTFTQSLEKYIGHTSHFSMGSDIADINNDGFTDIMTLDMWPEGNTRQKMVSGPDNYDKYLLLVKNGFYQQSMRNMLHLNNQGKSFSEIGQFSGVSGTDWSWSPLFCDLDNDGFKDIYITNGVKKDYTNMDFMNFAVQEKMNENNSGVPMSIDKLLKNIPSSLEENYTYRNNGDLSFSKVNEDWGLNKKSLSNGSAYADLDNDGDLDLVVNNTDLEAFVYRNNSNVLTKNNYLKIKLKGENQNTFGIGSKVVLSLGSKTLTQELMPTRGFQSSVAYDLVFGLGIENVVNELKVIWPDGREQILQNVKANQVISLNQADAKNSTPQNTQDSNPYFNEIVSAGLDKYQHLENEFVDFYREILLPHKLSIQGPKIASGDVNQDGFEDVFVGGAKGQTGVLYFQNATGQFKEQPNSVFALDKNCEDVGILFFDADGDKDLDLYIVSGGNEAEQNSNELQDRLYMNDGKGKFTKKVEALPVMLVSGSCVEAGDFDSDGDLDLFVGGRLVSGKYPAAPRSYILQNDGKGNFKDVTSEICPALISPGMVTDALWSDFNKDGKKDLIVVGEFMPIRTFENTNGKFTENTTKAGLGESNGWWNTIEEGDFDNDGDMDYVLGNFGLNSQLKASAKEPVSLYAKDFDNNGTLDPILCAYNNGENYPVFSKDDISMQLSYLKSRFVNYSEYANQKITEVFKSDELKDALELKAYTFSTSYLENLGNDKFKLNSLPAQAQLAPVNGIVIEDFNNDNKLDIVLGGNFYGTRVKYGRYDASKGTLLLGDGKGGFAISDNIKSGFNVDGEVRDIVNVKISGGKQMLIFARNNATLKTYLWQNQNK